MGDNGSNASRQGEFAIIERHFKGMTLQSGDLRGIGDDAAVIKPDAGLDLVVSTDSLLVGVHFPDLTRPKDLGRRAMCVNLSDMAAMGAKPRWFTVALSVPRDIAAEKWFAELSDGISDIANQNDCALVGGDTTCGPLTITITVIGQVPSGAALRRDTAKVGDQIYVTGTLGDGAAALDMLSQGNTSPYCERLFEHFYAPHLCIESGMRLREIASSCIDISDGLVADLNHICSSSRVAAEIDCSLIPIHAHTKRNYPDHSLRWALSGGDDYQLCFTVPERARESLKKMIFGGHIDATRIGLITAGDGVTIIDSSGANTFAQEIADYSGYDHFA